MQFKKGRLLAKPNIGGAVYILPNLLTTGNLFLGSFQLSALFTRIIVGLVALYYLVLFLIFSMVESLD